MANIQIKCQKWPLFNKNGKSEKKCQQVKNMLGNLCTKGPLWKGKYFYHTKHCLYLTMRQKYRTTEFISVRLMYLGHVLHRLSNYFLMSKICQGVYAKGPPPFSLATQAFREGHHCNLIESQPYDGAPRAEINAGMPISLLQRLLFLPLLTQRTGSTSKYILSIDRSIQWNSANTAN